MRGWKSSFVDMTILDKCKGPRQQLHINLLNAARGLMQVNRGIELEQSEHVRLGRKDGLAAKHEGLHGLEARLADAVLDLCNLQVLHKPFEINAGVLRTGHETIAA